MRLEVNGIAVDCVIGDLPDERDRLQRLLVDVELELPDRVAETDDLADTVDYAALAERVRARLVAARCRMVERAAKLAHEASLEAAGGCRPTAVRVTVTKTGAVPGVASVSAIYP